MTRELDFTLTEERELARRSLRELLAACCPPDYARLCDERRTPPREAFSALASQGWLGLGIPEEHGGQGGDLLDVAIFLEEAGRSMVDLGLWLFRVLAYGGQAVLDAGTDDQRRSFLPRVAAGELHTCFALTEPDSGSDAAALATRAVAEGGDYRIRGRKMFCSGLTVSDYVLVAARTDASAPKHRGISLFLVDTRTPGLSHDVLDMLGHRSVATTQLYLDDVRTPASSMLGAPNQGWELLGRILELERLCLSAVRTGGAAAALEEALAWAKARHQFGRPIGDFQAVSHKLAEMAAQVEISRALVHRYAWLKTRGTATRTDAAVLKLYTAEAYKTVADLGMQVMGGYGYSMESGMQRHYRDARLGTIGGGTSEIQKNIIARELGL